MACFLLDTNALSEMIDRPLGPVAQMILRHGVDQVVTSVICSAELQFGLQKNYSPRLAGRVAAVLDAIAVLPLKREVDIHYGRVRATLERDGKPIGQNDYWIAAHALSLGLTLVTDNVREFDRVEGLAIENWLRA